MSSLSSSAIITSPLLEVLISVALTISFPVLFNISPSANPIKIDEVTSDSKYWMYNVVNPLSDWDAGRTATTLALIPVLEPTTSESTRDNMYDSTSRLLKVGSINTHERFLKYVNSPPVILVPSLKKWLPNLSIWFCRFDCNVVNSLAWTGNPGLNKTLK